MPGGCRRYTNACDQIPAAVGEKAARQGHGSRMPERSRDVAAAWRRCGSRMAAAWQRHRSVPRCVVMCAPSPGYDGMACADPISCAACKEELDVAQHGGLLGATLRGLHGLRRLRDLSRPGGLRRAHSPRRPCGRPLPLADPSALADPMAFAESHACADRITCSDLAASVLVPTPGPASTPRPPSFSPDPVRSIDDPTACAGTTLHECAVHAAPAMLRTLSRAANLVCVGGVALQDVYHGDRP